MSYIKHYCTWFFSAHLIIIMVNSSVFCVHLKYPAVPVIPRRVVYLSSNFLWSVRSNCSTACKVFNMCNKYKQNILLSSYIIIRLPAGKELLTLLLEESKVIGRYFALHKSQWLRPLSCSGVSFITSSHSYSLFWLIINQLARPPYFVH